MNYVTYYIPSLLNMLPINFINYDGSFPTFYILILINKLLAVMSVLIVKMVILVIIYLILNI